ncbi:MAG: hypothetical protein OXF23_05580, partial [Candidatus Dadabacteria bacterium]|nr:hypothetical protein [Candidatus Dadabacteria bacterium]
MIKQNLREELLLSETIEKGMKGEENLSAQVTVFHKNAEIVSDAEIEQSLKNLVSESLSENTIKTYRGALRRLGAFMDIEEKAGVDLLLRKLDDSSLARYVA